MADRITRKEDKNHDFEPRKIMKSIMQIGKWEGGISWFQRECDLTGKVDSQVATQQECFGANIFSLLFLDFLNSTSHLQLINDRGCI